MGRRRLRSALFTQPITIETAKMNIAIVNLPGCCNVWQQAQEHPKKGTADMTDEGRVCMRIGFMVSASTMTISAVNAAALPLLQLVGTAALKGGRVWGSSCLSRCFWDIDPKWRHHAFTDPNPTTLRAPRTRDQVP